MMQLTKYNWIFGDWKTHAETGIDNIVLELDDKLDHPFLTGFKDNKVTFNEEKLTVTRFTWCIARYPGGYIIGSEKLYPDGPIFLTEMDAIQSCESYFDSHLLPTLQTKKENAMNNPNAAPNVDYIDYLKLQQIESDALQYWHSLRTDDPHFNAAHSSYQQAKENRQEWYTDHKAAIDSAT